MLMTLMQSSEVGVAADKFAAVQCDFERMKVELSKMMDKYNTHHRRSTEHKMAMNNKLHCLKLVDYTSQRDSVSK